MMNFKVLSELPRSLALVSQCRYKINAQTAMCMVGRMTILSVLNLTHANDIVGVVERDLKVLHFLCWILTQNKAQITRVSSILFILYWIAFQITSS